MTTTLNVQNASVSRTTFFGWPFLFCSGYRVSDGTKSTRWYRSHTAGHRFFYAALEGSEHRVAISEVARSEDKQHVRHEVHVNGSLSWLVESYDRTFWSVSYRVLDLDSVELLRFPCENWRRYNMFGHVLTSTPNNRGEVRIFEHGGVGGQGWPAELLIGIDLFKELSESI